MAVGVQTKTVCVDTVSIEGSEARAALADFVGIGDLEILASLTGIDIEGFTSLALGRAGQAAD